MQRKCLASSESYGQEMAFSLVHKRFPTSAVPRLAAPLS